MTLDTWFIIVFIGLWIAGPLTQLLQLVAPALHRKLGLMEAKAFEPEFKWFLLEERAIAMADLSFIISGLMFVIGAIGGHTWALPFGFFTCAIYFYFGLMCILRWVLLGQNNLSPLSAGQIKVYVMYMGIFVISGLFGMVYLWGKT